MDPSASNSQPNGGDGKRRKVPAVSLQTYGAIVSEPSDQWMIRLPNVLASAWEEAPEGSVLGTLTFSKGGGSSNISAPASKRARTSRGGATPSSSKISVKIDSSLSESQSDLPVNYTLEAMTKKTNGKLVNFTRREDGVVAIHGMVSRTATAQVSHDISKSGTSDANQSRYRNLLRNRLLDTTVNNKRFVQPGGVDATAGPLKAVHGAASLGTGFGGSIASFGQQLLDAKERSKCLGLPESKGPPITGASAVRSALFDFFSKKPFWAVKELRLASGGRMPERETRDVLRDIADYHRTGEHKNMWELKSDFKSAASPGKIGS